MPTIAGNYTPDELAAAVSEAVEVERTETRRLAGLLEMAQQNQQREEAGERISDMIRDAVTRAEAPGGEIDEIAEAELASEIAEPLKREKIDNLKKSLKAKKKKEVEDEINDPEWVASTKTTLSNMFDSDGTYHAIEEEVQDGKRAEIREELLSEKKSAAGAEVQKPESIARIEADVAADVDAELAAYRAELEAQLPKKLKDEAVAEGKKLIDEEVVRARVAGLEDAVAEWLRSDDAKQYRRKREEKMQPESAKQAIEEGKQRIKGQLLAERVIFDTYLADFKQSGINLSSIPEDTSVTVVMGSVEQSDNPAYGRYGNYNEPQKIFKLATQNRVLKLVSRGEGRFFVLKDSLTTSKDPFVRNDSVEGKIFTFGQKVEDGSSKTTAIETRIAQGAVLHADDDLSTPDDIFSTELPVVDVLVTGVHAAPEYKTLDIS